jgi:hypothetical protein
MVLSADLVVHLIQFWVLLSWKICLRTASRYALLVIVFMNNRGDRVVNSPPRRLLLQLRRRRLQTLPGQLLRETARRSCYAIEQG